MSGDSDLRGEMDAMRARFGASEHREILLSAQLASLNIEFAELRTVVYGFGNQSRVQHEVVNGKLDEILRRISNGHQ